MEDKDYNDYIRSIEDEINEVLDKIKPFLQRDGGDCTFEKFDNGVVFLKIHGACVGCAALETDLKEGIESILVEEIPEVVKVVNVDDFNFLEDN